MGDHQPESRKSSDVQSYKKTPGKALGMRKFKQCVSRKGSEKVLKSDFKCSEAQR